MRDGYALDERLAARLPLPLAQLYRRADNAKGALERHLTAFYLWEASLKLLASAAVVEYAQRGRPDSRVAERLTNLARPALGHWWEFARLLVPALAEAGDAGFARVRDLLLGPSRADLPRCAGLDALLRQALEGKSGARTTVRLAELYDRLVTYRNKGLAHGAPGRLGEAFHERMAAALLAALAELLARLDVLAGRRLVHVAEVREVGGHWLVERRELIGENARRLPALELPRDETARLPGSDRVYLDDPAAPRPLHPLLVYEAEAGKVLFLNARRGRRRTEYLCYTTGETAERPDLGTEQCRLLAEVLGMDVAAEQVERWAARSQAEEPAGEAPPNPGGRLLGEFELLSELGRGGMGVVYRAWQPSLGRQVALKAVLPAGDPKAEARFAREVRALGKVEHPHLVKVFTSGSEGDRWFYAMELIEGAPLAAVCESLRGRTPTPAALDWPTWQQAVSTVCEASRRAEKPLAPPHKPEAPAKGSQVPVLALGARVPPDRRSWVRHVAALVRQVAEAAHALHEAGVIHRDIKPGNILLTADGSQAVLTDLGLAQLVDDVQGKLTRTRQFVGTLRYASPEQVLAAGGLDRRSDVYSLGATLWELLTLRPLYGVTEETPPPEVMRRIQYQEPERPRRYHPGLPRDLEAVALKCLEKDAARRYATARELADDLGRFLAGEPVLARPVGGAGRCWRWCRRNPVVAGLVTTAAVALLAGTGVSSYFAVEASRRAADALREKERADRTAAAAVQARDRAETNFRLAVDTNLSVGDLADRLKPIAGTQTRTVTAILDLARRNYDRLLAQTGETPAALAGQARMLTSFSDVYLAMNRSDAAAANARQALAVWQGLLAQDPDNRAWYAGLARSRQRLGQALGEQGDSTAALAAFRSALNVRRRLVEDEPDNPEWQGDLAVSLYFVAAALRDQGDDAEAEQAHREALRLREALLRQAPDDPRRQRDLAMSKQAVGDVLWSRDRADEAAALYREALDLLRAAVRARPDNAEWQGDLARAYFNLGFACEERRDPGQMRAAFRESAAIYRRLADADPRSVEWQRGLIAARLQASNVLVDADGLTREQIVRAFEERVASLLQDLALAEHLADDDPHNAQLEATVAGARGQLGVALAALGRLGQGRAENLRQALACQRRALELYERLARLDPANVAWGKGPSSARAEIGGTLQALGDGVAALREQVAGLEDERAWCERRARQAPANTGYQSDLARCWRDAGLGCAQLAIQGDAAPQNLDRAVLCLHEAGRLYESLADREPENTAWREKLLGTRSVLFRLEGKLEEAAQVDADWAKLKDRLGRSGGNADRPPAPGRGAYTVTAVARQLLAAESAAVRGRALLSTAEVRYALEPGAPRGLEVVETAWNLGDLLAAVPTGDTRAEARRAWRRALAVLAELRKRTGPGKEQQAWTERLEAALAKLPADPDGAGPDAALLEARDALDYRRLAGLLLERNRPRDLVGFLIREDRVVAAVPAWRAKLGADIALEPRLLAAVLDAARALRRDDPDALDADGRRTVALLAWYAGDDAAATDFDFGARAAAPESALVQALDALLLGAHRYQERARFLADLLRREPGPVDAQRRRDLAEAQLLAWQGDRAEATVRQVIGQGPGQPADQVLLGRAYLEQRRFAQAEAVFRTLLEAPGLPANVANAARYHLALAYLEAGESGKADAEVAKFLQALPGGAAACAEAVPFLVEQGKDLDRAEEQTRRALRDWPDYPPYVAQLGWVLNRRGRAEEGLKLLEQVSGSEAVARDPAFWDRLGDAAAQAGQPGKARAAWQKALALFPATAEPGDRRRAAIERKLQAPGR